ncbi:MAG: esterase family protein [Acidobacteria bacterium]|nr:esterase family protein [Acidobacteriota bacterium]MBI3427444.1 esterase family protein [Acidobacteriota bacterium]
MSKLHLRHVLSVIFFCLLSIPAVWAQESKVFDDLLLTSRILKKEMKYALYLPAGYETSRRQYPVLYLLHGGGGNHSDWIQLGNMQAIVDTSVRAGQSDPMIIVMPDAEMTFYLNNIRGEYQYEDYFIKELLPHIEKTYRCRAGKAFRSIAGLSMGGFGSLLYALHHPDLFQSCYAMSAAVRTDEQINQMPLPEFQRRYRSALGEIKEGDQRITDFWNQNSILSLVKNMPEKQKAAVRFFLDCGDDDTSLYTGNGLLHNLMRDLKIPHEYRVRDGGHTWEYWRTGLPEALRFISLGMR